ncbi:MAG: Kdo hydroxylase family protein [Cyanobacteria bacterium SZAS-4]|nr:Kdo hydroxylase family protein [Cyanobacteria bacterium SZAS-4]
MSTEVIGKSMTATTSIDYQVFMTDGSSKISVKGDQASAETACQFLEKGGVIYFPESPFKFSESDKAFLLAQKQKDADYHKNIAYRPKQDRVTGFDSPTKEEAEQLRRIMADFHGQSIRFLQSFLSPYARNWKIDFASFRPIEEKGRKMRLRARNDLLHVDSFPTRPIFGDRILRTFININPTENRVWRTSETFEKLAETFQPTVKVPGDLNKVTPDAPSPLASVKKMFGLKANGTSPYDSWMLDFHNFLKENNEFQENTRKDLWQFPPNSSWIVFTDMVSHSVLSGKFALEQTIIVDKQDLVLPEKAPINILKRIYNRV